MYVLHLMRPGNTPLVELRHWAPPGTRLFAKCEWYNPTGSIKDRPAFFMYHNAIVEGLLTPGQPLIEATSGNTGIGLARLALIGGHPMVICLPKASTEERKQLLRAYGAELIEVDGGPNDAIAHARSLVDAGEGHMCYQYGNRWNPYSHFFGTALEILRDWPLPGPPDRLIAAYGTGGTLTGNTRSLRLTWPELFVHAVEEDMSDPIGGMRSRLDPFQPPIADLTLANSHTVVAGSAAVESVAEVMQAEGLFVGTSSGAVLRAAREQLDAHGGTAVALLPDAGWKYLSGRPWSL